MVPGWKAVSLKEINAYVKDSDHDGLLDGVERDIGTSPYLRDTDGDGFSDLEEVRHGRFFGYGPLSYTVDSDLDGLSDSLEEVIGTNPYYYDSDKDGFSDLDEFLVRSLGYDPTSYTVETRELKKKILARSNSYLFKRYLETGRMEDNALSFLPESEFIAPLIREGKTKPSLGLLSIAFCFYDSLYYTYDEMVEKLGEIWKNNPDITQLFEFSLPTYDGHRIWALKISDNPAVNENEAEILYVGDHHARELISVEAAMNFIEKLIEAYRTGDPQSIFIVNEREVWVVPMLNPDGHLMCEENYSWRKNTHWYPDLGQDFASRGVDLNRNYPQGWQEDPDPNSNYWSGPAPLSEREDSTIFLLSTDKELVDHFLYSTSWHSWIQGEWGHQYSWIITPSFPETHDLMMRIGHAECYRTAFSNAPRPPYHFNWEISHGTHEAYQIEQNGTLAYLIELFGVTNEGEPDLCFPYPCDTSFIVCDTLINPLSELTYQRTMTNSEALARMEATFLKGVIDQNLTINFPIYLTGDVIIPDSVTLILGPKARIYTIPLVDETKGGKDTLRTEIIVQGEILAQGKSDSDIVFSSFTDSPSDSDWYGIEVLKGGKLNFDKVHISNSLYGVHSEGELMIEDCLFGDNKESAIFASGGDLNILDSKIDVRGECGITLLSPAEGSSIKRNEVVSSGGSTGISLYDADSTIEISYNTVQNLLSSGISMRESFARVSHNFLIDDAIGLNLDRSSPLILRNLIEGCGVGVKASTGSHPLLGEEGDPSNPGFNSFRSFFKYAIEFLSPIPEDSLIAENNYWGTPYPTNSLFMGHVDFTPWLEKDPFQKSPSPVTHTIPILTRGYLEINSDAVGPLTLRILNASGRLVKKKTFTKEIAKGEEIRISLSGLSSGVYFYILGKNRKQILRGTFVLLK